MSRSRLAFAALMITILTCGLSQFAPPPSSLLYNLKASSLQVSKTSLLPPEPCTAQSDKPCGDGKCDEAERADPSLCPKDCEDENAVPPGDNQSTDEPTPTVDPGAEMYLKEVADPLDPELYLGQVNTTSAPDSKWQYESSIFATMPGGEKYDIGAFCRTFKREDGTGYDVIYGGAFHNNATGEERYNGDVYRLLRNDFTFQTTPTLFSPSGGDFAIDSDGKNYYLLNGGPLGWVLRKYDLSFKLVKETTIELGEKDQGNDQMVRVFNGFVFASGMYDPFFDPEVGVPKGQPDTEQEQYTHLWIYDTDLNYINDFILDDAPNINGGTLLFYEGIYAYIASENFWRNNLVVLLYDEDWNFIDSKFLQEDAEWSMGATFDNHLIYVAYHKGDHGEGDVYVDIYDTSWTLLETIEVTRVNKEYFNAQRPWIQIYDDLMLVSYDMGRNSDEFIDLQCIISMYTRK